MKEDLVLIEDFSIIFNKVIYECKLGSFNFTLNKISTWKSTGIFNHLSSNMKLLEMLAETYLI